MNDEISLILEDRSILLTEAYFKLQILFEKNMV